MANKKIQDLPILSVDDYDPDQDLILIQKPDGASYQMNAINVMNPVAGGVVHLDEEIAIFSGTSEPQNRTISLSSYVPSTASTAILSAMQPRKGNHYVGNPHFDLYWFNNSNFSGKGHYIRINGHDRATWAGMQFMCPIIDQKVYLNITARNTTSSVVLNAYM